MRAKLGHLVVDLVICYRCKSIRIFQGDTDDPAEWAGTQKTVREDVSALFLLGLKIAK